MSLLRTATLLAAVAGMTLFTLGGAGAPADASAGSAASHSYEVVITNITAHQVLTPFVVATTKKGFSFFEPGDAAGVPLEMQAEGGATGPLAMELSSSPDVHDVVEGAAPLPPGQSVSFTLSAPGHFRYIALSAMLVPTNDSFTALQGIEGPKGHETLVVYAPAYDAGTEVNDELCANIPAPPGVCTGEGFNPDRTGAEGFISVHRGIHGVGDLPAETYDWRNPVCRVEIHKVN